MKTKIQIFLPILVTAGILACKGSNKSSPADDVDSFPEGQSSTVVTGANLQLAEAECKTSNIPGIQTVDCRIVIPDPSIAVALLPGTNLTLPSGMVYAEGTDLVSVDFSFTGMDTFNCSYLLGGVQMFCTRESENEISDVLEVQIALTSETDSTNKKEFRTSATVQVSSATLSSAQPTGFTLTAPSTSNVSLVWNSQLDSSLFSIQRSTDGVTYASLTSKPGDAVSHNDGTVGPGTTYYYRIRACNTVGCSAYVSSGAIHTPDPDPGYQVVFVTSVGYDGHFGGLSGADVNCNALASAASLGGTWKAILSTSSVNAKDHVTVSGEVRNIQGQKIADDATDLWDGALDHAIRYDENGDDHSDTVRTGTLGSGLKDVLTCNNWSSSDNSDQSSGGDSSTGATDAWINMTGLACDGLWSIYCINGQNP